MHCVTNLETSYGRSRHLTPDTLVSTLLDRIDTLLEHLNTVEQERTEWKEKAESLILDIESLQNEIADLEQQIETERAEFVNFANRIHEFFDSIRAQAKKLISETQQ